MKKIIWFCVGFWIAGFIFKPAALPSSEVEKEVRRICIAAGHPELIEVIRAESGFNQWDKSGNVLLCGPNRDGSFDKGVMQINSVHFETARRLGYNLDTIEGNIAFGIRLHDKEGLKPWNSSKHRWGPRLRGLFASR